MRYVIMCGGSYKAWDTPRQLTEIEGEPVVERTIRLLRENGVEDIAISTNDDRFLRFGVPLLHHFNDFNTEGRGCWVDAFYPIGEPACYLMGDVVFSEKAIRTIVEDQVDDIQFYASCPPFATVYTKRWAEPFAFKVMNQKRFRAAIDFVRANESTGIFWRRPIAWELWAVICGYDVQSINYNSYVFINDYTCDIDHPEDAYKIERAIQQWRILTRS